jgi:hypothetical protein
MQYKLMEEIVNHSVGQWLHLAQSRDYCNVHQVLAATKARSFAALLRNTQQ